MKEGLLLTAECRSITGQKYEIDIGNGFKQSKIGN